MTIFEYYRARREIVRGLARLAIWEGKDATMACESLIEGVVFDFLEEARKLDPQHTEQAIHSILAKLEAWRIDHPAPSDID